MSAAGRFWLSLAFASIRLMRSSTPDDRAELPGHEPRRRVVDGSTAAAAPASCFSVSRRTSVVQPVDVVVDDELAVDVRRHVVPGRDDAAVLATSRRTSCGVM